MRIEILDEAQDDLIWWYWWRAFWCMGREWRVCCIRLGRTGGVGRYGVGDTQEVPRERKDGIC